MSALVGYGSSDEGEESDSGSKPGEKSKKTLPTRVETSYALPIANRPTRLEEENSRHDVPENTSIQGNGHKGPVPGPQPQEMERSTDSAPQSPYSTVRSVIRELTLPSVPDFDIPESPRNSPPLGLDEKIAHFETLKENGLHFNEQLARSSALKNPNMFSKLMELAEIKGNEQYSTSLSIDLWDPTDFPAWAYKDELAKAQVRAQRKKEDSQQKVPRSVVDFVPSSGAGKSTIGVAVEESMQSIDGGEGGASKPK